jgi:hypothetical protein
MNWLKDIPLAADNWDISDLAILVAVVVFTVISALFKKAKQKYGEQHGRKMEDEYERQYRASQPAPPERAPAPPRPAERPVPMPRRVSPPPPPRPQPVRMAPAARPPRRPVLAPQVEPVQQVREAPVGETPLGEGVQHEVGRLTGELDLEEQARRQRLSELPHLRAALTSGQAGAAGALAFSLLSLRNRRDALQAMVSLEVLGPCKALGTGPEPWER